VLDDGNRLYLRRYWEYEHAAAESVRRRVGAAVEHLDTGRLRQGLADLFPDRPGDESNWQKTAAAVAALKRFSVITGGPGTGKTFTIARLLVLVMEQYPERRLRIHLAAPTGKAAARMRESLKQARDGMRGRHPAADQLPEDPHPAPAAETLPGSPYFRHNRENLLETDIVVVDEASMVDMALMAKLLEAVPSAARLVLVGDKDQLASVEAGSVLGDICDRDRMHGFSAEFRETLGQATSERFDARSGRAPGLRTAGRASQQLPLFSRQRDRRAEPGREPRQCRSCAGNSGHARGWLDRLAGPRRGFARAARAAAPDPRRHRGLLPEEYARGRTPGAQSFQDPLRPQGRAAQGGCRQSRRGALAGAAGLIRPEAALASPWYAHRPVLVTRNDYALGLFSGDIGMTLPDEASGSRGLFVFFPGAPGETRRFLPYRLPEHETVYAMTVHKSQGSEFDEVLLVLPDRDSPVLTRELLYTA
jgi:exodeoxyribonuclease V alpha subunit